LHSLAEEIKVTIDHHRGLFRLVPVICQIAHVIRPEWADYWKRFCPDAVTDWSLPDLRGLLQNFIMRVVG
jgi:anaphase-promoting complex subunit 1